MSSQGRQKRALGLAAALIALLVPTVAVASTGAPVVDPTVPAGRDSEPVILSGQSFAGWSVPSNQTAKAPGTDLGSSDHNHYADPEVDTADAQNQGPVAGTPTNRVLGYRWDPESQEFVQVPFQVDEVFTRYLDNSASGFAIYSGEDQHTTYAFDREGFRFTASDPNDPCHAVPALDPASDNPQPDPERQATTPDPISGLDDNDELVFMASDTGPKAPTSAILPEGIEDARAVTVTDPLTGEQGVVYVMKAADGGPQPAYDADNGYVRYARDSGADTFVHSESSYDNYGKAPSGPYCDQDGNVIGSGQRRPGDQATISTDRYRFRYDGRWLMTGINVSPGDDGLSSHDYGPDMVDRWKARAFQQDPESETPCCGYEEEDTNWGGSSQLLGERAGPVRAIRATWGADSGTNVIRQETFYRDEVRQKSWLRVHVIPPLDGIYAQWDFNAGIVNRYFNPKVQQGVPVDGKNDEQLGNLDDPCNPKYDAANNPNDTSQIDQQYRSTYEQSGLCPLPGGYHQSVDVADPTMSTLNAGLDWNEITGPDGTIVDRYEIDKVTDETPGGAAQSLAAVPYYRDDSCFDDGTGTDPGLEIHPRGHEPTELDDGTPRKCWDSETDAAVPGGDPHYFQGDIGTHGLHLLFQAESDNARLQVPITEIVSEQRMVMLPGQRDASVGEAYGHAFEKPLVATTTLAPASPSARTAKPEAEFSADPSPASRIKTVTLDASGSHDPDSVTAGDTRVPYTGAITRYQWDLDGDGSFETDGGTSPTLTHTFTTLGAHQVGLRVTDNSQDIGETTHEVTVVNLQPSATLVARPDSVQTGEPVDLDGSGSSDPDGSIVKYQWDLDGDGSFETDTGSGSQASTSFDHAGTYQVGLRVTDDSGATSDSATDVRVANRPPTPGSGPGSGSGSGPQSGDAPSAPSLTPKKKCKQARKGATAAKKCKRKK